MWFIVLSAQLICSRVFSLIQLPWRHNGPDSVSNHQPHDCLLSRLFRRRSKKISKLRVTGLCVGNSPETGEFPAQMASNAENVLIWWRHHENWDGFSECTRILYWHHHIVSKWAIWQRCLSIFILTQYHCIGCKRKSDVMTNFQRLHLRSRISALSTSATTAKVELSIFGRQYYVCKFPREAGFALAAFLYRSWI